MSSVYRCLAPMLRTGRVRQSGIVGFAFAILLTLATSCGSSTVADYQPISPKWIEPDVHVAIPLSEVEDNINIHFKLMGTKDGNLEFMAYKLDGKLYVRSNACPPCHDGFTLNGVILECDSCTSTFDARTGAGIEGGCANMPKEAVPYEIRDGRIIMKYDDLIVANRKTLEPDPYPTK